MPGKRARRYFSQLSEFERGLIIGMKTAGWSTCRVAGQVDRSECAVRNCWEQWTREGTHVRKTWSGATRKTTWREDKRIVWQALVNPTKRYRLEPESNPQPSWVHDAGTLPRLINFIADDIGCIALEIKTEKFVTLHLPGHLYLMQDLHLYQRKRNPSFWDEGFLHVYEKGCNF
ncbi:uncharacterized protein TNCV_2077211 [Trichonephila clavipes]|nr:uncharacterized protein TNCV_2077211 [Trichonephila clavipes]